MLLRCMLTLLGLMGICAGCAEVDPPQAIAETPKQKQKAGDESASAVRPDPLPKSNVEWKKLLTGQQFYVTRQKGTEKAFTGEYWDCHKTGVYRCVCCGEELFSSDAKFNSGTGWPSYWQPIRPEAVKNEEDTSHMMQRTEVVCRRCGAHLGHVFNDGPRDKTGLRYCINSVSLKLEEKKDEKGEKKE